jgi:two-component system response regulator
MTALKSGKVANNVTWVKDGEEALEYLFRHGRYAGRTEGHPRLVFLDLKMPKVNGIEVLKAIKSNESTRRIPVVVMTSSQEDSDIAKTYDLGVNSYVVKPVDFTAFADVTRQAGYYWLAINRSVPT